MKFLLLSNSTNAGEEYLGWPREIISAFIIENKIKTALFLPYAGVTVSWDDYETRVQSVLEPMGCSIESIHHQQDAVDAVINAECIIVGGGNTFRLVEQLYSNRIVSAIREKVFEGVPFLGWSAGSNIACPTLRTTNDMPIIEPESFKTLNLLPFQINPHYLDANPEGHGGETREQRIQEFLELNRDITVVGLREATALKIDGESRQLLGNRSMRVFKYRETPIEVAPGSCIDFLWNEAVV